MIPIVSLLIVFESKEDNLLSHRLPAEAINEPETFTIDRLGLFCDRKKGRSLSLIESMRCENMPIIYSESLLTNEMLIGQRV